MPFTLNEYKPPRLEKQEDLKNTNSRESKELFIKQLKKDHSKFLSHKKIIEAYKNNNFIINADTSFEKNTDLDEGKYTYVIPDKFEENSRLYATISGPHGSDFFDPSYQSTNFNPEEFAKLTDPTVRTLSDPTIVDSTI